MPKILLLCGSLRATSLNRTLLDAAAAVAPAGFDCVHDVELKQLPLYDQDLDTDTPPPAVARFRRAIAEADGLLVATPEYNHGMPGGLKNGLDWASRPYGQASLSGKALAVFVATTGAGYGFQAHAQLRATLADMGNFVVQTPLLTVQRAADKLKRGSDGEVSYEDPMGHRLLAATWEVLRLAIAQQAGPLCVAGNRALAAASKR